VLAEVAKRAEGPLFLAELTTGDGIYRSLSLVNDSYQPVVQLNVLGDSAAAGDEVVEGIWPIAAGNPRLAALMLLSEGDLPAVIEPEPSQITSVTAIVRLASLLTLGIARDLTLTWGWVDGPYGVGPHPVLDEFVSFPAHWLTTPDGGDRLPWQGHVFVVSEGTSGPLFAINVTLDEAVAPDGSSFDGFPRELHDEEGLPIAAIGARLTDETTGEELQREVHASMARYAAKLKDVTSVPQVISGGLSTWAQYTIEIDNRFVADHIHIGADNRRENRAFRAAQIGKAGLDTVFCCTHCILDSAACI
jgi:hypothetical protein